jgi:methyltransferase (TIGR00027 family)
VSDKVGPSQMLGVTAHWTAAVRARESEREDRLFNDPWAFSLAGTEGLEWVDNRSADSVIPIVLRTRFFDDFLVRIAVEKGIRQVVVMAAGLDTRAFRLAWPEPMRLFELDQGPVLEYKEQTSQLRGRRRSSKPVSISDNPQAGYSRGSSFTSQHRM